MGGVDLADMRRLHCNLTIMGQNRWWLKLFFYILDVGTSNALVLYNESARIRLGETGGKYSPMNVVQFKMELIVKLVGKTMDDLFRGDNMDADHTPIRIEGNIRHRCAYCAIFTRTRRTRYKCKSCGIPFCSIGNGRVEDDCFTLAHESEKMRQVACNKYEQMKKFAPNKNKN
jgi:hypothetical protein